MSNIKVKEPKWIPCEKSLPEGIKMGFYLVMLKTKYHDGIWWDRYFLDFSNTTGKPFWSEESSRKVLSPWVTITHLAYITPPGKNIQT